MDSEATCRSLVNRNCAVIVAAVFCLFSLCSGGTVAANAGSGMGQSFKTAARTATVARTRGSKAAVEVTAVRNLDDEKWLERLEIEIKNISAKPIYHVVILIVFLDTVSPHLGIPLIYGRHNLILPESPFATADDKPIRSGESYVFRVPKRDREGLENRLAAGIVSESKVKRLAIAVDDLSFGDGTGFNYSGHLPFSYR